MSQTRRAARGIRISARCDTLRSLLVGHGGLLFLNSNGVNYGASILVIMEIDKEDGTAYLPLAR